MWVGRHRGSRGGAGVAPPVFRVGKSHPATGTAVYAGRHKSATSITANHGLVAGRAAFAAFVNCFVLRHDGINVNAYKLTRMLRLKILASSKKHWHKRGKFVAFKAKKSLHIAHIGIAGEQPLRQRKVPRHIAGIHH